MSKIDLIIDALERANELWLTEPMGEKAIAAAYELKAELAKPEQAKYSDIVSDGGLDPRNKFDAQPEQAPFKPDWVNYRQGLADGAAQPEPKLTDAGADTNISRGLEPKGSGMVTLNQVGMRVDLKDTPPRKEWVGLTDDEINKIVDLNTSDDGGFDIFCDGLAVARIVCVKLKELNK
jgi:hypothetical protein